MSKSQPTHIYLPPPREKGSTSLEEAIVSRRSVRDFAPDPISQSQLSQILWAAQGITDTRMKLRTAPSAGATYPLVIFVICGQNSVEKMGQGIYHYNIDNHSLNHHHNEDVRTELTRAASVQDYICQAPLSIVICAVYDRTLTRYGSRTDRYVHIEVGHTAQNIYLQVTALGLVTVALGAFNDERVSEVLRLDKQYKPLYIMPVGKPA